jgi:hypothetical protein
MLQEFQSSTGIVLNVSLENINAVRL